MNFYNKTIIITGGASGIGKASVENFCNFGTKVVIADLNDCGHKLSDTLNAMIHKTFL